MRDIHFESEFSIKQGHHVLSRSNYFFRISRCICEWILINFRGMIFPISTSKSEFRIQNSELKILNSEFHFFIFKYKLLKILENSHAFKQVIMNLVNTVEYFKGSKYCVSSYSFQKLFILF